MKAVRHEAIIRIINSRNVDTQERLRELLENEGIAVTQATLSRDIRELRLKKAPAESGGQKYIISEHITPEIPQIFRDSVIKSDHALNTVVFKCHTGMAQAACAVFDRLGCSGVVGTLAGDDTIFVLMRTENEAAELAEEIAEVISEAAESRQS